MNREFMELYNRELGLFYEHAQEFSEEYPGVAERLGSLARDNPDPLVGGLLEGAAFLATRVHLKLKYEFEQFTSNLLEQLCPNFLAPTPSFFLAKIDPDFSDDALKEGLSMPAGSVLDATYRERDRQVACRYQTRAPLHVSKVEIEGAEYINAIGPLEALGIRPVSEALGGLKMTFRHRTKRRREDEPKSEEAAKKPETWAKTLKLDQLDVWLVGPEANAVAIYEQVFGHIVQAAVRYEAPTGRLETFPIEIEGLLEQPGFEDDRSLFPINHQVFRGFDFIREYFCFPQKFLGFRLKGLRKILERVEAPVFDLILVTDEINPRLPTAVDVDEFALYCVPCANLFEKTCDRIRLTPNTDEYQIVPERSRYIDYEPHQALEVYAHYGGGTDKVPVYPLYSSPAERISSKNALFYTIRRGQRRRTIEERKYGMHSDYMGTDMFLTLIEPGATSEDAERAQELSVRAYCSNRHLPEHLPVGETGADFYFLDDDKLPVRAMAKPTSPREPILAQVSDKTRTTFAGENSWRLINMLRLNHLGLLQSRAGDGARALKDILSLFGDLTDPVVDRRIRGVRSVNSRPIARRVRALSGVAVARGLEVTVTIEDRAFEGSGVFLLGAVLDRFFAEYVGLNQFTQVVIRTPERNEIMRWPPRLGRRPVA